MYSSYRSNYVGIFIERDGHNSSKLPETVHIQDSKTVSDLLDESRSKLGFTKHDKLSAHKIPSGERIPNSARIGDIAYLGTVVIKCGAKRVNHEHPATHKKIGLVSIPEKQDGNSGIRLRGDLSGFGATRQEKMTTAYKHEITFPNLKLKAQKVEGFAFHIVPGDYKDEKKEFGYPILTFHSQKELREKQSKIRVIPDWSSWQPGEALPCWGIRINNNLLKDDPSQKSYRNRNLESGKIPTAIVTKTSYNQVTQVNVNVTLDEKAVKEAKKILKGSEQERQNTFQKFTDKYCSFVYSGKFCVGAWLRTVTTARCFKPTKGHDAKYVQKCATEETEHWWSSENQTNRSSGHQSPRKKNSNVTMSMSKESDPPYIYEMNQLRKKIGNVKNCTVFPANWHEKSHFTPVYKIMRSQAEANNDEDLRKVSDIFKECMKETCDLVTDMEVDECSPKMRIDAKEEETIEKMDTQTTAQETSYRGEAKATDNHPFMTENSNLQNAEGQSWKNQSSKNMYNNDYSSSRNWYGPSGNHENRDWKILADTSFPFSSNYRFMKTESEATLDKKLGNIPAKMTMDDKPVVSTSSAPYVVFLGDTGTGKSTIVEKLTGEKERSSNDSESFTSASEAFVVQDGKLIVADTPGSNCRKDKVEHNIWIAGALNYQPVSRIFIVSKAQPRIDSVIDNVCKYADNFVELPPDVIGVLVSHMDMVEWTEEDFISAIDEELGIDAVIFSSLNTTAEALLPKILETCTGKHDLTVNHENFAKLFKIPNNHIKILKFINDEVKKFTLMKAAFDEKRKGLRRLDQIDLAFEFLTYMSDEIANARDRMIECNDFTFEGDSAALEAGHLINMVNQLHTVLFEIRKECFEYQCEHGVSEFRKCPYCGLVWTKKESCSGDTICGNADSTVSDTEDETYAGFGTFSFAWESDKLKIKKKRGQHIRSSLPMFGCGKTINWKDMATVELRSEFRDVIRSCSSGIKVDPSRESILGRIGEATREFTSRWCKRLYKSSS